MNGSPLVIFFKPSSPFAWLSSRPCSRLCKLTEELPVNVSAELTVGARFEARDERLWSPFGEPGPAESGTVYVRESRLTSRDDAAVESGGVGSTSIASSGATSPTELRLLVLISEPYAEAGSGIRCARLSDSSRDDGRVVDGVKSQADDFHTSGVKLDINGADFIGCMCDICGSPAAEVGGVEDRRPCVF